MPPDDTGASAEASAAAPAPVAAPAPAAVPSPAPAAAVTAAPSPAPAPSAAPGSLLGDAAAPGETPPAAKPGEGEKAKEEAPPGAPEQYVDFKMPEGVKLDEEVANEFKSFAKEKNLPQDEAQKVFDMGAKLVQRIEAQRAEAVNAEFVKWSESSRTDKEFGGEQLQQNLAVAKDALAQFGSPELKQMLNESGFGNHPEMIRLLYKVGKATSEDKIITGKQGATAEQNLAQRMYPGMNP